MDKYPYTICFIRRGESVLLLNRERSPWMGCWNGVGGKIAQGESPYACILREVYEETGIELPFAVAKGVVSWTFDGESAGGMYAYVAELPTAYTCDTPRLTSEGILDWKATGWVLDPQNLGVARNIRYFLPSMLSDEASYEHRCIFTDGKLERVDAIPWRGAQAKTP